MNNIQHFQDMFKDSLMNSICKLYQHFSVTKINVTRKQEENNEKKCEKGVETTLKHKYLRYIFFFSFLFLFELKSRAIEQKYNYAFHITFE